MRKTRVALLIALLLAAVVLIGGALAIAVLNDRNAARPEAVAALVSDGQVAVTEQTGEDWFVFSPVGGTPDTGFIIYPGGFVDPVAYAPVARDIAANGYLVVIDPMPLNLVVLNVNGADAILPAFPEITHWAIGGHSLGGAMAAEYAAGHPDAVDGLALWAAYPANSTDLSDKDLAALSIYGDRDGIASIDDVLDGGNRLPDAEFVLVPGGNHTQFGRYGEGLQRGDNPASISRDEQQRIVADGTSTLLSSLTNTNN